MRQVCVPPSPFPYLDPYSFKKKIPQLGFKHINFMVLIGYKYFVHPYLYR